jgi:dTDP-4-amino-4,6-dideoxygalactose transaminase
MIQVTKSFLPSQEDFNKYLNGIWERNHLTNHGPLVNELEKRLEDYLQCDNVIIVANGTIALQIAFKALELKGDVITTPFSYVATTSSLVWEGLNPIFVDIDERSFNIDPNQIEENLTRSTHAILATHVFGNPCDVDALNKIAEKNNLRLIYDASHCFDVNIKGQSVLQFGDISTLSFHATKPFHTVEGGAVICRDNNLAYRLKQLRNFGHKGYEHFDGLGINGKQSEFHSAMGLCVLDKWDFIKSRRKEAYSIYMEELSDIKEIKLQRFRKDSENNFAYFPVVFENENVALKCKSRLEQEDIYPRRYFYPSLDTLSYVSAQGVFPVTSKISKSILCLPLHHDIDESKARNISNLIKGVL